MTLLDARPDQPVRILDIGDSQARAQCIRFGIGEGTVVEAERLKLGPVLVRHANSELALGRDLARKILVETAPAAEDARIAVRRRLRRRDGGGGRR